MLKYKKNKDFLKHLKLQRKLKEQLKTLNKMKFKKIEISNEKEKKRKKRVKENLKIENTKTIHEVNHKLNEKLDDQDLRKCKNEINEVNENMKYQRDEKYFDKEDSIIHYLEKKTKHIKHHKYKKNKKNEFDSLLEDLDNMTTYKRKKVHFKDKKIVSDHFNDFKSGKVTNINDHSTENKNNNITLFKEENTDIPIKKIKENSYNFPVDDNISVTKNYNLKDDENDHMELTIHLRRKIKGLLNRRRLSESNMLSILNEIKNVYNLGPRHHVNLELITLLLTHMISQTTLKESYLILYSGFVAALYRIIGMDFGISFLQKLIKSFNEFYLKEKSKKKEDDTVILYNKECINLIIVLSELYNLQVVSCVLIYDLVKLFLNEITDLNTELLLKIILNSGSQLRYDDPSSLKDIVIIMHQKISETNCNLGSTRTKFMIESIDNLKNNKIKDISYNISTREAVFRMKKLLGTLSNHNPNRNSGSLRISLNDLESMDESGKWLHLRVLPKKEENKKISEFINNPYEKKKTEFLALAQSQRMNTDIRKSIFITIMTAEDFVDAFEKLLKLGLKKVQKLEIPKVLLHCCGNERNYNPYYTYIALRLCVRIHFLRTAFKFCLWDLFRFMGEKDIQVIGNINDENMEDVPLRRIVNLGKLYATLVVDGGLDLTIFKKLNFIHLQPKTKTFMEIFFHTLILEIQKGPNFQNATSIQKIFGKLSSYPFLIEGIKFFFEKYLKNSEILNLKKDKEAFIWGFKKISEILDLLKNI
ncbi:hypothetical protein PCK1_002836 [Pneumocystis canis]|nr:hypothetical protein PCK1_002836 [Pneumocystis canis]